MKIVYLASPYRNESEFEVYQNIHRAQKVARQIWALGLVCISPCGNTAFFSGIDIPESEWLDGDLEILRRCDALFANEGWENSLGCTAEMSFARSRGLPICYDLQNLRAWANENK